MRSRTGERLPLEAGTAHRAVLTRPFMPMRDLCDRSCSNLDLIKTLKDEVEELRSKEAMHERSMFAIAQVS